MLLLGMAYQIGEKLYPHTQVEAQVFLSMVTGRSQTEQMEVENGRHSATKGEG
jgi:hypothetical protein